MRNNTIAPKCKDGDAIDFEWTDSVALQRLIDEVRHEDRLGPFDATLYNRTYHRHNR